MAATHEPSTAVRGAAPAARLRRGRLTAFVAAHQLAWDLAFGVLAIAYLAIGIAADAGHDPSNAALLVLAVVFIAEFAARLWDAPSRYAYLRAHWIDIVSAIPLVGGLRSLRVLRLLRLGAALRILAVAEAEARARGGGRHSLWYVGPALLVVWFTSATAYYVFERGANAKVSSFGDALYWAFATATTVGYGSGTPVTAEGKVLSGALILVSIGLVGVISSRLVAAWLGRDADEEAEQVRAQLAELGAQMTAMSGVLAAMQETLVRLEAQSASADEGDARISP